MTRDPIHLGERLSAAEFARRMKVPVNRVIEILNGFTDGSRRHWRHGAAHGPFLRDVGRVLAQPAEAL